MPTLDLDTITLSHGSHSKGSGKGCVMEWTSVLAGEPWSDSPQCTSPVIAAFLRSWNDSLPDDERQQLKRYIPLVINTRGSDALEAKRAWMATDWLVRVQAPAWLRLAGLTEQAALLEGMPEVTATTVPSIKAPLEAVRKEAAAAWDAAWAAAWAAARAAAWDAARDEQNRVLESMLGDLFDR